MSIRSVSVRSGTTAEWAASTLVLHTGELGVDREAGVIKVGDGTSVFADLDAALGGEPAGPALTLTAIDPDEAVTNVQSMHTLTGTGFLFGATLGENTPPNVYFGASTGQYIAVHSDTELEAWTPAHAAGVVDVKVENANDALEFAILEDAFTFNAP